MARWGDEKTLNFIYLYRDHECLWNIHSPMYKNKFARENAYQSLITSFGDKSMNLKSVKIKIKNLRTIYHTELKRVKYSIRSGSEGPIYKPILSWFNEMHSFLGDSVECRDTINNEIEKHDDLLDKRHDLPTEDTNAELPKIEVTPAYNTQQPNHTDTTKLDYSNICIIESTQPTLDYQSTRAKEYSLYEAKPKQRKLDRKKRLHDDNDDIILNALQRLENIATVVNLSQQTMQPQDEYHYFALSIAAQLRNLPLRIAVETQSKIQNILSTARLSSIASNTASSSSCNLNSPDQLDSTESQDINHAHGISVEIISENIKQECYTHESQIWEKP